MLVWRALQNVLQQQRVLEHPGPRHRYVVPHFQLTAERRLDAALKEVLNFFALRHLVQQLFGTRLVQQVFLVQGQGGKLQ